MAAVAALGRSAGSLVLPALSLLLRLNRPGDAGYRCAVKVAAALVLGVAAGVALGALKWRGSAEAFHREARMAVILAQARQMPPGGVLVIGDSVTERVRFDRLCDRPALNAGISWATSKSWLPDARKVIAAARPSIVVVEIGTNDQGRFAAERRQLTRLATFTVPPPRSTVDGVHPDARGAAEFRAAIERGCHGVRPSATIEAMTALAITAWPAVFGWIPSPLS